MDMNEMLQHFAKIREEQGEEAFEEEVQKYASKALEDGVFPGMPEDILKDFKSSQREYEEAVAKKRAASNAKAEQLKQDQPTETDPAMLRVIQQSLPGLKSQAQFNTFMVAFDALKGMMNAIFEGNKTSEDEYRKAFDQSLDAAKKVTDITEKLSDVPEAAGSKLADEFRNPPRQFGEYDVQKALLLELSQISALDDLTRWWAENRQRIDQVVSPSLRNPLIDAVRVKKAALASQQ